MPNPIPTRRICACMATPTGHGKCSSPRKRCLPSFLSRRSASTSLATACRCALPDRAVPKISAARCLIYPRTHLPHPRARRLTPRTHPSLAEEGLARARRGALRRVADGGGVLLRRQVRREGAVRFPVESSALQREIPPPRVPFRENDPNTTPRKPLTVPAPFTRTGRNSSSASTRFPRCTRSSLARRPPSPRRTKSPPPWCRYASLPDSPLPKSRRMSCFAHSSLPPVCLTPSLSSAASREKASHGELAESRGDQETLPGVHLESRREPGAP